MDKYVVMTASAKMPSSCKGTYRRVAVVQLTTDYIDKRILPKMISDSAMGVARIVETWERLNVGSTPKSAYHRALAEATAMVAKLNAKEDA